MNGSKTGAILARLAGATAMLLTGGCGAPGNVKVLDQLHGIQRVAIVDVSAAGQEEGVEYFTNEFVSIGYEVVERANLSQILQEGFSKSDYLDQETLAAWGRGKAVRAIVLFKLVGVQAPRDPDRMSPLEVSGWVRIVDVETGIIMLAYNATYDIAVSGRRVSREFEALQKYAERVVDEIRRTLIARKLAPGAGPQSAA